MTFLVNLISFERQNSNVHLILVEIGIKSLKTRTHIPYSQKIARKACCSRASTIKKSHANLKNQVIWTREIARGVRFKVAREPSRTRVLDSTLYTNVLSTIEEQHKFYIRFAAHLFIPTI